jgi:hypothetical protein
MLVTDLDGNYPSNHANDAFDSPASQKLFRIQQKRRPPNLA